MNDTQEISSVCRRLQRPQPLNLLIVMQYDVRDMAARIDSSLEGNWIRSNKYEGSAVPNCRLYDTVFISPY